MPRLDDLPIRTRDRGIHLGLFYAFSLYVSRVAALTLFDLKIRNQNRVPTAQADIELTSTVSHTAVLNGSASEDPEGMPLTYQWYIDPPATLPDCAATPKPASCGPEGVVVDVQLPTVGPHTIVLLVKDPAGLPATYTETRLF